MVLESVVICLDNSEFMRNGDCLPNRLKAQQEACHQIVSAKLNGNPETLVGVMTSAGDMPVVLVNPCREPAEIMGPVRNEVHLAKRAQFRKALQTAQLCLKHRPNKAMHQRVVAFVGSPLEESTEELVTLGAFLKKNGVAVDVVNFGAENAENENLAKLQRFVDAVNDEDNSHLVRVPPGPHILADLVLTSPIILEGGGAVRGGHGMVGGGAAAVGGDMEDDLQAQLEMAMRMSLEEEARRQQQARQDQPQGGAAAGGADAMMDDDDFEDDDPDLAAAIALSMAINQQQQEPEEAVPATPAQPQRQEPQQPPAAPARPTNNQNVEEALQDPEFIDALVGMLENAEDDEGDEEDAEE